MKKGNRNIILTGFMGTGKTTIGKRLATMLQREFIDTDVFIENREKKTIPQIFEELGESAFRKMEMEVAAELGQKENLVISTGGRLLLEPANVEALGRAGDIFCLTASPETILERVGGDKLSTRPLLNVADPKKKISELLKQRQVGYNQFETVSTDGKKPEEIAEELKHLLEESGTAG